MAKETRCTALKMVRILANGDIVQDDDPQVRQNARNRENSSRLVRKDVLYSNNVVFYSCLELLFEGPEGCQYLAYE